MPCAMTKSGTAYYLTYDPVGTLRVVADQSGSVVKRIEYDSFGNVIADTDPSFEVPFGFVGGLYDRDTGLVRFGYRDYDPDIGRWTAKDPIFFAGGDTDLYGYCLNDPVNWVDPDGLDFFDSVKDFFKSIADAIIFPPPSLVDPDAMKAAKKVKDAIQDRYDEWGETFDQWGPENPWYYNPGVKTRDGVSYRDRIKPCLD